MLPIANFQQPTGLEKYKLLTEIEDNESVILKGNPSAYRTSTELNTYI